MNPAAIGALYRYNDWANQQILDAASQLPAADFSRDLKSSHRSIRDTLTHIIWSEWIWLQRWNGVSPKLVFPPADFPEVKALRERFHSVSVERFGFLRNLSVETLLQVVEYTNLESETWRYPLWQQLHHVVNHSTYHRGQVVTLLRQLGATAPATDLLVYYDQGGS